MAAATMVGFCNLGEPSWSRQNGIMAKEKLLQPNDTRLGCEKTSCSTIAGCQAEGCAACPGVLPRRRQCWCSCAAALRSQAPQVSLKRSLKSLQHADRAARSDKSTLVRMLYLAACGNI